MEAQTVVQREVLELYDRHSSDLFQYVLKATENRELAEEAVQDVFFRYFVARTETGRIPHRRAWLFRAVRQYLESRTGERPERGRSRPIADWRQHPEREVRLGEIAREMNRLTPRELACVRLRIDGMRYEEIASALSIRSGTVGALLTRAVAKLRRTFGGLPLAGSAAPPAEGE